MQHWIAGVPLVVSAGSFEPVPGVTGTVRTVGSDTLSALVSARALAKRLRAMDPVTILQRRGT